MINDNEVRMAISVYKKGFPYEVGSHEKAIFVLLDLAQAYLKSREVMPTHNEIGEMRYGGCNPDFDRGYNQAIEDCTLAYMKREAELEKKLEGKHQITAKELAKTIEECAGQTDWDSSPTRIAENIISKYKVVAK